MPLFTAEQLQEIRQIIEDHHDAFVVNTIGSDAVPADVLARLREKGLVNVKVESIKDAYLYGQLLGLMQSDRIANMSYDEFKAFVKRNPVPLSEAEAHAVRMAQEMAGQACKGLGNRVNQRTGAIMIEADQGLRARTEGIIRDATALNTARRETVSRLKSDLGWASKDWTRDWNRIAVTEKQNAMQHGVADHYRKEFGGDVLVAKRAMPDACKHCKRLHNGPDGQPRIFRLSELEENGTNIGRKAADWLPVVGTVHPHCQCQLIRVPEGWGFDEDGDLVPGGELGVRYDGPEDVERSMRLEDGMQKAFRLQGHVNFKGLPIDIENRAGSIRTWDDGQGGHGETRMAVGYGYIRRTNGIDEDEIDVFVGPDPKAEMVYVIEQQNPKAGGLYDEHKCFVGFPNQPMAESVYLAHYDNPDFMLYTTAMTLDQFKRWIQETGPRKGEMMKASESKYRLVIPLSKARVAPIVGAAGSPAGNRAPSPGTSPNYIMQNVPPRPQPQSLGDVGYRPDSRDLAEGFFGDMDLENPLKVDREVYEFPESERIVRPVEIPEEWNEAQEQAREGADRRMKYLLTESKINAPRPKNTAEVPHASLQKGGKDRAPTLNKQDQFNVIEIGPRGGKIIGYQGGKPIYLHKLTSKQRAQAKKEAEAKQKRQPVPKEKPEGKQLPAAETQAGEKTTPPEGPPEAYDPDPAPKNGGADVARVGVPAKAVPPPPKIPRLPNLTPEEREIESQFIAAFEADPDGMAQAFYDASKGDNFVFETDGAKALFPGWNDSPEFRAKFNTVLHQVANAIAKRAFLKRLDEIAKMPEGQRKILVTSGGVAGGKGSALKAQPELAASVAATWDAAGEQNAIENEWLLDECEKRGIKPTYLFVAANPEKTWGGAIARAKSIGRMVDARVFADSYAYGAKNFKAFYDKSKNKASFVFAQAGEWQPETKTVSPAQILSEMPAAALAMDAEELYRKSLAEIERQKADLPPHIVAGATAGLRIWKPAGKEVAA